MAYDPHDEYLRLTRLRKEYPKMYWAGYGNQQPCNVPLDKFGCARPFEDMMERWESTKNQKWMTVSIEDVTEQNQREAEHQLDIAKAPVEAMKWKHELRDTEASLWVLISQDKLDWPEYERRIATVVRREAETERQAELLAADNLEEAGYYAQMAKDAHAIGVGHVKFKRPKVRKRLKLCAEPVVVFMLMLIFVVVFVSVTTMKENAHYMHRQEQIVKNAQAARVSRIRALENELLVLMQRKNP